jgi:hypothetical protein
MSVEPDLNLDRLIAAFVDAVSAVEHLRLGLTPAQQPGPTPCEGWSALDIVRHLRCCVGVWNEWLDADEQGFQRPIARDLSVAAATQHKQGDPGLIGLIWQQNDSDINLSDPWPVVLTASGRRT